MKTIAFLFLTLFLILQVTAEGSPLPLFTRVTVAEFHVVPPENTYYLLVDFEVEGWNQMNQDVLLEGCDLLVEVSIPALSMNNTACQSIASLFLKPGLTNLTSGVLSVSFEIPISLYQNESAFEVFVNLKRYSAVVDYIGGLFNSSINGIQLNSSFGLYDQFISDPLPPEWGMILDNSTMPPLQFRVSKAFVRYSLDINSEYELSFSAKFEVSNLGSDPIQLTTRNRQLGYISISIETNIQPMPQVVPNLLVQPMITTHEINPGTFSHTFDGTARIQNFNGEILINAKWSFRYVIGSDDLEYEQFIPLQIIIVDGEATKITAPYPETIETGDQLAFFHPLFPISAIVLIIVKQKKNFDN